MVVLGGRDLINIKRYDHRAVACMHALTHIRQQGQVRAGKRRGLLELSRSGEGASRPRVFTKRRECDPYAAC